MSLQLPTSMPLSTIFVLFLAMILTFITSLANRLLTNREQLAEWRKQISEWQKEFNEARKSGDKKQLDKAMRKQKQIMQIQSKMFTQQMKVSLIFIVPFFLFWTWLNSVYSQSGAAIVVAFLPGWPLGPGSSNLYAAGYPGGLTVFYWYLLCSLAFGTIFSHILGIGMATTDE
jgi:uncharacterized membrane protein (DUF106 family)